MDDEHRHYSTSPPPPFPLSPTLTTTLTTNTVTSSTSKPSTSKEYNPTLGSTSYHHSLPSKSKRPATSDESDTEKLDFELSNKQLSIHDIGGLYGCYGNRGQRSSPSTTALAPPMMLAVSDSRHSQEFDNIPLSSYVKLLNHVSVWEVFIAGLITIYIQACYDLYLFFTMVIILSTKRDKFVSRKVTHARWTSLLKLHVPR